MEIRKAVPKDLDIILKMYEEARRFMAENGNPNQWINGYPGKRWFKETWRKGSSMYARRMMKSVLSLSFSQRRSQTTG